MASASSNLPDIIRTLDRLSGGLALDRDGLGKDMLGAIAEGIADRSLSGQASAAGAWDENRGKYGEAKRGRGLPIGVGLKKGEAGGQMLSLLEIAGEQTITADEASMRYGTEDAARRKASWYTRGSSGPGEGEVSGATDQPPRPFFELDPAIEAEVARRAEAALAKLVDGLGA